MATKLVTDLTTGQTTEEPLTAEEEADRATRAATGPAEIAARDAADTERTAAASDLLANVLAAYQRLGQIQTQMATVVSQANTLSTQTFASNTARDAALNKIGQGMALVAQAVGDEATDLRFLARKLAADLGFTVTDA